VVGGFAMKNRNIKKYKMVKIGLICIVAISMFFIFNNSNKDKIVKLVNNNREFMNECVEDKDYEKIHEIRGIKKITPYYLSGNELYIDLYCYGSGLVPSSTYHGFYYSSNDEPIGFQAAPVKLESDGYGWKWIESNGDNRYYTEKIADHWYYYEAAF